MGSLGGAGADGLSPLIDLAFPLTNDGSVPARVTLDQPTVEAQLKARMKESSGWGSAHQAGFGGLPAGVPMNLALLMKIAEQITGIPVSTWVAQWNDNPVVSNISTMIENILGKIYTVSVHLQAMFQSLNFLDPDFSVADALETWTDGLKDIGLLLGWDSPLNSQNLFNLIPTDLMAMIPSANIGDYVGNLIANPFFQNMDSVTSSTFDWDEDVSHTSQGGSARVTADGSGAKDLLSNLIPVTKDQSVNIGGWVKWTGLTGSGTPIRLGITAYLEGSAVLQPDIVTQAIVVETSGWRELQGSWTIPADVDAIRIRVTVAPSATAGTVWWDDLRCHKVGKILTRLVADTDGNGLPDVLDDLFGKHDQVVTNLDGKAGQGQFMELVSTIGGDIGDDIEAAGARLEAFLTNASDLHSGKLVGDIADDLLPGLRTAVDKLVTGIRNISGSGFSQDDMSSALEAQQQALVGIAAQVAQLTSFYNGGISEADDLERTSSTSLGAGWLTWYSSGAGLWATPNGHDASWIQSGAGDREFACIRNTGNIRSTTNTQLVTVILGSKAERATIPGIYNYTGHNDVWLRVSDASTSLADITGIRVRFGGDGSIEITRWVNGISTVLNSVPPDTIAAPGPGTLIGGQAGIPGTARHFTAILNGGVVLTAPEVGTASGLGGSYLRWGHGGRAEGALFSQMGPGSIHQWNAMDALV